MHSHGIGARFDSIHIRRIWQKSYGIVSQGPESWTSTGVERLLHLRQAGDNKRWKLVGT